MPFTYLRSCILCLFDNLPLADFFRNTEMLLKIPVFWYVIFSFSGEYFRRFGEPRVLLDPEYKDTSIIQIVGTYLHRYIPETGICSVISMSVPVVTFKLD